MADAFHITPDENEASYRIDVFLSKHLLNYSRSKIQSAIKDGHITVNKRVILANYKVKTGDNIKVDMPSPALRNVTPQDIPLDIYYEDSDIIVINKPQGMVVHPGAGNYENTLVNALLFHCNANLSEIGGVFRPGIVHRIDKDTSGLLVAAKNDNAHCLLAAQFHEHSVKREYTAIACGVIKQDFGIIDKPIGRSPNDRKKMAVNYKNGKRAVTHFTVLERYKKHTLLKLNLETGRTHQIRVHLSYISHPLLGDAVYGGAAASGGQALHAGLLGFIHPGTNKYTEYNAPPPEYFIRCKQKVQGV